MKDVYVIKQTIESKESNISKLEKELTDASYHNYSDGLLVTLRGVIYMTIASVLMFGQFLLLTGDNLILMGGGILFTALTFITALRLLSRHIAYTGAKINLTFWALILASNIFGAMLFNKYLNVTEKAIDRFMQDVDIAKLLASFIDFNEFPVYFINNTFNKAIICAWLAMICLTTIPVLTYFIISLVKFIKEAKDKSSCEKETSQIKRTIVQEKADIAQLKAQMQESIIEADKLYLEEIQKETPDENAMREIAKGGSAEAALLVALDLAQDLMAEKTTFSTNNYFSKASEVDKYIVLAEGCAQEDLRKAIEIWNWVILQGGNFNKYSYTRSSLEPLKDKKKALLKLEKSDSELVHVFVSDVKSYLCKAIKDTEAKLDAEEESAKKSSSYSGGYSGGYSSGYSSGGSLSDSEIRAYHENKLHGLWNPNAVDSDTSLTDSQKAQIKSYNNIYGD